MQFLKFLESLAKSAVSASTICNLQFASSAIEGLKFLIREASIRTMGEKLASKDFASLFALF